MIPRILESVLKSVATRHPVVTLTGPRQSGKTTLCRSAFPDKPYVSLEPPDEREFAQTDPRGFLQRFAHGAVIDEVQRVPDLLSYIQGVVDAHADPGRFILTGSQNFGLTEAVSQTLAGRSALLELLPLSLEEIRLFPGTWNDLPTLLWSGGYPRIYDRSIPPAEWLASYTAAYVERDVRQVLQVGDLLAFQTFLRLCAGRAGQLLNLSAVGSEAGISQPTARAWLSVLESSYIAFRLPPMHRNANKQLIKTAKLYFYDTGLLCYLLGIRSSEQLATHPLRGPVFESWVASEIVKLHLHRGQRPNLCFYRDRQGHEVDFVLDRGTELLAIEAKAGATPSVSYFAALSTFAQQFTEIPIRQIVVYAGSETQQRTAGELLSWSDLGSLL